MLASVSQTSTYCVASLYLCCVLKYAKFTNESWKSFPVSVVEKILKLNARRFFLRNKQRKTHNHMWTQEKHRRAVPEVALKDHHKK